MNEKIATKPKQITQWSKKWCIRLMRYADIKKASEDEWQNQTTQQTLITSKNLCPF